MCALLNKLNNESEMFYRRCGDIIVAPERNVFALYCNLCEDVFMHWREFIRHARQQHDDEYDFGVSSEDNVDIYDLEEIIGGMTMDDIDALEKVEWERRKKSSEMGENEKFEDQSEKALVKLLQKENDHLKLEIEILRKQRLNSYKGSHLKNNCPVKLMKNLNTKDILSEENRKAMMIGRADLENSKESATEESMDSLLAESADLGEYTTELSISEQNSLVLISNDLINNSLVKNEINQTKLNKIAEQNTKASLVSGEIMKSMFNDRSDLENLTQNTTESSISVENINSLLLENIDLEDLIENTKGPTISEGNMNSLMLDSNDTVKNDMKQSPLNVLHENATKRALQSIDAFSDQNIKNTNDSMVIERSDLENIIKNTTELSISEENINSLQLESADLEDLTLNTIRPTISDRNINSLILESNDLDVLNTLEILIPEENINSLVLANNSLGDLQKITKELMNSEENINSLEVENPDMKNLQKITEILSTTQEKSNSFMVKIPQNEDVLLKNSKKNLITSENIDSSVLRDLQEIINEASISRNNLKDSRLENCVLSELQPSPLEKNLPDIADLQKTTENSSILEITKNSLVLENPDLADLLTEFDTDDLDSFDMKIFEKLTSPNKINSENTKSFELLQQKAVETVSNNTIGDTVTSGNMSKEPKKRGRPKKENKSPLEKNKNIDFKSSASNSNSVQVPTMEIKKEDAKKCSYKTKSSPDNIKSFNNDVLNHVSNKKQNNLRKLIENEINIILNHNLEVSTTSDNGNNKNLRIENASEVNTPVKDNSAKANSKLKNNHLTENESLMKTANVDPSKSSPEDPQFHKSLKVRIKKLSPSPPTKQETITISNSKYFRDDNKFESEAEKVNNTLLSSKSVIYVPQNISIVPIEADTPVKNIYCKQNFTEHIFKNPPKETNLRNRKASIDIVPSIENIIETPLNKNKKNIQNNTISRTTQKNVVLQRMTQIRKRITQIIDKDQVKTKNSLNEAKLFDSQNVQLVKKISDKKSPIKIQNVVVLQPNNSFKTLPLQYSKKPKAELDTPVTIKTQISNTKSLLKQPFKIEKISPKNTPMQHIDDADLMLRKPYVSDSVVAPLQNDLSKTINSPQKDVAKSDQNLTNQSKNESTLLDDLLSQVAKEEKVNKMAGLDKNMDVKKAEETEHEQEMLNKIGLKFIKKSDSEVLSLDEEEEMYFKAKKIADILKKRSMFWYTKNSKHKVLDEHDICFNLIKQEINSALEVNLTLSDVKRVCNLVMSWYTNQNTCQLIDKKDINKNLKKFFELFTFLPKTGRPIFYCEFCAEQFRSEHSYVLHRCTHIGGDPYNCNYCGKPFSRPGPLKTHESKCNDVKNELNNITTTTTAYTPLSKYNAQTRIKSKRLHSPDEAVMENNAKRHQSEEKMVQCNICHEQFNNAEKFNAHKEIHVKRMYECQMCKMILPSLYEIQKHVKTLHKKTKIEHISFIQKK